MLICRYAEQLSEASRYSGSSTQELGGKLHIHAVNMNATLNASEQILGH